MLSAVVSIRPRGLDAMMMSRRCKPCSLRSPPICGFMSAPERQSKVLVADIDRIIP